MKLMMMWLTLNYCDDFVRICTLLLYFCFVVCSICVCVCVCVYVNNFQIWLCEVLESYSVSVYTRYATLLLYHTSNTICNGAGIKEKLKPMHKYWQ